ncbi:hypothetical protein DXA74_10095 [Bacteroides sp. OF04-15BH]|nr:hypothetical protein DXA74_10095 [Bacteroides sp. OF04-15BH]
MQTGGKDAKRLSQRKNTVKKSTFKKNRLQTLGKSKFCYNFAPLLRVNGIFQTYKQLKIIYGN